MIPVDFLVKIESMISTILSGILARNIYHELMKVDLSVADYIFTTGQYVVFLVYIC